MTKGYVYVLSNPCMPGLVKIGRSAHGGAKRAVQLQQTGVPVPFNVEFEILTEDCEWLEQAVHEHLDNERVDPGREFFAVCVHDAIIAVLQEFAATFDHSVEQADLAEAAENIIEHARRLNAHPVELCCATRFLSDFSLLDALKKYHAWVAANCARRAGGAQ